MSWRHSLRDLSWQRVERIAPVLLAILLLLLCWRLASIFWWFVAPPQFFNSSQVVLGSQQDNIPNISHFSLFYEVGQSQQSDELSGAELQGVMVAQPQHYSSAVIKLEDHAERYRIGESIGDSAYQLAEVYWDHVVLSQGAIRKVLKFNGIDNLDQPLDQNDAELAMTAPQQQRGNNSNSNVLGQAIEQLNNNQAQYLQQMGVNPGEDGYEVTEQTPAALRQKLGLIAGDRILSINGQNVGQGSDAQLLEQAKRTGKVKIDIKRGEQVLSFEQSL
ncbi:type II secretion system protein N [Acinetobacter larvae]|uniref:General secretion pathway protein n=1 Tax=Acinetobacter larvae TaxID=1789224 RepID=A0A1B2M2X7_9GAMM|nr:type II secretion system protein N [Acinetobacter larvae]AOA59542.1 general secretion pathway protein [Acinetobacter larvae]